MKIATLGPKGTFSHEAVLKYSKDSGVLFKNTIWDVFESIKLKEAELGIVPVENSTAGTVGATLDALMEFDLNIIKEIALPIVHNLAGNGRLKDVKALYAHPQTLEQCKKYIRNNLREARIMQTTSNGMSAELIRRIKDKERAAIVPSIAIELYGLKVIESSIQDNIYNVTRFFVVAAEAADKTGKDRTSIAIYPQTDRPGLLYGILGEFAKRKINLTKIESRPSKGKLGDYVFFIDLEGHQTEKHINEVLTRISEEAYLKVLGSYPRAY